MQFNAGQLTLQYENGFLRWITAGNDEVLRMIYFAVRDKHWGTVAGKVVNEKIKLEEDSFMASYEMLFEQDEIAIHFHVVIEGRADNSITFEIRGKSLTSFKSNRIGLCILHPIKECAGKEARIIHSDKSMEEGVFPVYISPQQPFKNITSMQWLAGINCSVLVEFEGDIFETEDQRNWSDNSYKTYCTPLELPFPVLINEGDEVFQKVTMTAEGEFIKTKNDDIIEIGLQEEILPIPKIGIGRASKRDVDYEEMLKRLSKTGFNHYRAEIHLVDDNWKQTLRECFSETGLLNAKLEIVLFVYAGCAKRMAEFIHLSRNRRDIQQIIVLESHAKCINNQLLNELILMVKEQIPGLLVGSGTDTHFAELNRSHLDVQGLDFVSFSLNPQVHAFDDMSLMENAAAQGSMVASASQKFNVPVNVSPVTLKNRYIVNVTDKRSETTLSSADARQQTGFCAAWTLVSLKSLMESNVSTITYYETAGERGIASYRTDGSTQFFPVFHIFKKILSSGYTHFLKSYSTKPSEICCLAPVSEEFHHVLVANLTNSEKIVRIVTANHYVAADLIKNELVYIESTNDNLLYFKLASFQIIILKPV